jgi:hypothetical protein
MAGFRFLRRTLVLAAAGSAGLITVPARADDCADLLGALKATAKLTHHQVVKRVGPDGTTTGGQIIQTSSARYAELRGTWHQLPVTTDEMLQKAEKMVVDGKMTCRRTGNESLNGKAAVVYAVHTDTDNTKTDSKVWVEGGQRILKSESKSDGGLTTSDYDYDKVQVPTNAVPLGQSK